MAGEKMENMGKKKFNIRWSLVVYDIILFLIMDVFLLVLFSGNEQIGIKGVIQHTILAGGTVYICRMLGKIYGQIWRYGGIQCYIRLIITDGVAFVIYVLLAYMFPIRRITFARMVALISMNLLASLTIRMFYRYAYKCGNWDTFQGKVLLAMLRIFAGMEVEKSNEEQKIKVAIIGAGRIGVALAEDLLNNEASAYVPRCFVDIKKEKVGREIHGIPVLSEDEATFQKLRNHEVQEIIFAIHTNDANEKKKLYEYYKQSGCKLKTYDYPVMQAAGGKRHLREFDIEELLFRKPVDMTNEKTVSYYRGK